ncbi:hypothetical protein [uncultured Bacteroides sp.]|uniref:hypothetical protein n=1 Tax=uncultured Bacteroides sp. TaxID=162156 RepID=UPI002AABD6A4|nr:hypothetical protein [uncultured Bacteroides sp.]
MTDYSTCKERDAFDQAVYDLVNEYLQDSFFYPDNAYLAINAASKEMQIGALQEFDANWITYPIEELLRENEDNKKKEVDIDVTFDIASEYFFVR